MSAPHVGSLREHYPDVTDLEPFEEECWPEDEDESEDEAE